MHSHLPNRAFIRFLSAAFRFIPEKLWALCLLPP